MFRINRKHARQAAPAVMSVVCAYTLTAVGINKAQAKYEEMEQSITPELVDEFNDFVHRLEKEKGLPPSKRINYTALTPFPSRRPMKSQHGCDCKEE